MTYSITFFMSLFQTFTYHVAFLNFWHIALCSLFGLIVSQASVYVTSTCLNTFPNPHNLIADIRKSTLLFHSCSLAPLSKLLHTNHTHATLNCHVLVSEKRSGPWKQEQISEIQRCCSSLIWHLTWLSCRHNSINQFSNLLHVVNISFSFSFMSQILLNVFTAEEEFSQTFLICC